MYSDDVFVRVTLRSSDTHCETFIIMDALAYMEVCTVTHDAVYYVFAHRQQLDFASVLDHQHTIALPSELLMTVLYAHTRVGSIVNFCLNPSFTLFDEFHRYFQLYWAHQLIDVDEFGHDRIEVGHPSGHLYSISYLGHHYGGSTQEQSTFLESLWSANQDWAGVMIDKAWPNQSTLNDAANWSTIDIDHPYTCVYCDYHMCSCSMQVSDSTETESETPSN